jgi:beta-galactosidase
MLIRNSLILKGEKILLFSGEIHFWRIDPEHWGKCLNQLKLMGINIVSTYLSWGRHSISPEENDLAGKINPRLNLPAFLNLCVEMGLWVILKPGPWICAEEKNGGYPDWLVEDKEICVKDKKGILVQGYIPEFSSYIPSYLHPKYLEYVKKWLDDVDKCIKNFCYPRGPIIFIQLDNEPSMTFHDKMFESDYNPINIRDFGIYQKWLKKKYKSVRLLNIFHNTSYNSFIGIEPPVGLNISGLYELRVYTDWVEFKEWLIARHIEILREIHLQNGIRSVIFTVNFNEHTPMAVPNNWNKLEQAAGGIGGYDYYAVPPLNYKNFIDFIKAINYSLAVLKIPWAPEMMCGIWKFGDNEVTYKNENLLATQMNNMYLLGLAYGLKGMNFYMFVNRENWKYAPVDERGQSTQMFDIPKKVIDFVKSVKDFHSLQKNQKVAIMYYRPYAWEAYITLGKKIKGDNLYLGRSYHLFESLYTNLVNLNYDPAIFDPFANTETDVSKYKLIFVPSSIYMDVNTQKFLKRYVEKGGAAVFFSELPNLDLDFWPCSYLKEYERYAKPKICHKLSLKEILIGKGMIIRIENDYLSNDGVNEDESLIDVLDSFLKYFNLRPEVETNDRHVLTVVQRNNFEKILFVTNMDSKSKEVRLKLQKIETGRLEEIFSKKTVSYIKNGVSNISIGKLGVEIFRILE